MTLQELDHKHRVITAIGQQADGLDSQLAQAEAALEVAKKVGDHDRHMELTKQSKKVREAHAAVIALLGEHTGKATLDAMQAHVKETGIKLQRATQLADGAQQQAAQFELVAELGNFDTPEERAAAEKNVTDARNNAKVAFDQLDRLFAKPSALVVA